MTPLFICYTTAYGVINLNTSDISALKRQYDALQKRNLNLDLSRGKPEPRQLELSGAMLRMTDAGFLSEDGQDTRNYGNPTGIPEAKRLFGEILGVPGDQVIIGGNSSMNLIYDVLSRAMLNGPLDGDAPWAGQSGITFLCPVPGYDWHFHMLKMLGIRCVPVPLIVSNGALDLDMDTIERLATDPSIKGIICVPMYSNPSGITFSDAAVDRLARMETGAKDFRILWDNAYCMHHLYPDRRDRLKNIYAACAEAGNPDRPILFTSTSKVTYAGGGVSAMAGSADNMARQAALMMYQVICYDKVNQLRHARFLPNLQAVNKHMEKHAEILRPKFDLVLKALEAELSGIGSWTAPRGGYFVCYSAPRGCAKRTVELCAGAGITLTPAGAAFPYGIDPDDSIIRIAPTYLPIEALEQVMQAFPTCVKLAYYASLK